MTIPLYHALDGALKRLGRPNLSLPGGATVLGPGSVDISTQGTVRTANSVATIVSQIAASSAGDTVTIAAGTYGAVSTSKSIGSGLIRIVHASGATVNIASVNLTGAQGLDWRGANLTGSGVYMENTVRCRWRGGTSTLPTTTTAFEVRTGSSDVVIEDVTVSNALNSFYIQGFSETGRATNITIQRCRSNNVSQDHFFGSRGDNITVQDCIFNGHTENAEHQDGIQIVGLKDSTFRRCWIYNSRAFRDGAVDRNDHGVIINYTPTETPEGRVPANITLENLLIHDMTAHGIAVAGCLGLTVRNCTIYDNGASGTELALSVAPDSGNTISGLVLVNNIFSRTAVTGATVTTNTNNFVADGSGPAGTNRLTGTPGFVSAGGQDYRLTSGSQNRASGTATGAPANDLYSGTRPASPSRGAIE